MAQPQNVKFDLLSNARDSLKRAVELLAWKGMEDDSSKLKHAITNAAHAVELLLKERLRRVHPAMVWENVDKYPNLEARTVTVDAAISRLKNLGGISLSERDEINLRSLRKTRNAIEHYEWRTTRKEAKLIIGNALSFAFSFSDEHLGCDLSADLKTDDTWASLLEEMYEFTQAHGSRLEAKLRADGKQPACCERCGQLTAPLFGGSCELCGHWQDA